MLEFYIFDPSQTSYINIIVLDESFLDKYTLCKEETRLSMWIDSLVAMTFVNSFAKMNQVDGPKILGIICHFHLCFLDVL